LVRPPGIFAISPAAGAVPPQLLPVFQSELVVPVQVLVAALTEKAESNTNKISRPLKEFIES
jgi:hypothetical protein